MITLLYKCRCMYAEVSVPVRNRRDDEDVIEWMDNVVTPGVGDDHARRSPICRATQLEYLKIPIPENAPFLGGEPVTQ